MDTRIRFTHEEGVCPSTFIGHSPKPTHDLSSLQHGEFMLLGKFKGYQKSLFAQVLN